MAPLQRDGFAPSLSRRRKEATAWALVEFADLLPDRGPYASHGYQRGGKPWERHARWNLHLEPSYPFEGKAVGSV